MEKVYISYCTEYELGWGSRSDGVAVSKTLKTLNKYIQRVSADPNYECYWTYSEPVEMLTNSKEVKKLDSNVAVEYRNLPKGDWFKNINS